MDLALLRGHRDFVPLRILDVCEVVNDIPDMRGGSQAGALAFDVFRSA